MPRGRCSTCSGNPEGCARTEARPAPAGLWGPGGGPELHARPQRGAAPCPGPAGLGREAAGQRPAGPRRSRPAPAPGASWPAGPAHSPAHSLVGQLLHAVELLLHGGGGPRGSGRAGRDGLAALTSLAGPGGGGGGSPGRRPRPLASLPAAPPADGREESARPRRDDR